MTARLALLIRRLSTATGHLAAWGLVATVAFGAAAALLRTVARPLGLSPQLNALADLQWMGFGVVVLFAAAWALADEDHVRVDVLYGRLGARGRAVVDLVGTVALLLPFCGLLLWAVGPVVAEAWAVREGALDPGGLPRWPVKVVLPGALGLLALQGIARAIEAALVLLRRHPGERLPGERLDDSPSAP